MDNKKSFIKKLLSFGAVALATSTVVVNFALAFFSEQLGTKGGIAYGYRENDLKMQEVLEKYGTYYNDYVIGGSSTPFYSYDFSKINKQFAVNGKNMTDINQMKTGETMYVLIGSNAYIDRQGRENPIGAFLKCNGTSQHDGAQFPTASIIKQAFYDSGDINDFVWKLTKLDNGNFAISSCQAYTGTFDNNGVNYSGKPAHSVLCADSGVRAWPSGSFSGTLTSGLPDVQEWIFKKVTTKYDDNINTYDANSTSDTLYNIQCAGNGGWLNVSLSGYSVNAGPRNYELRSENPDQWARKEPNGTNITPGYAVNYFSLETGIKHTGGVTDGEYKKLIKTQNGSQPHRWSEWLVLPLLQDFEKTTYGYTGRDTLNNKNTGRDGLGITSTISSLSKITPHNAANRKARNPDGTLVGNGNVLYADLFYYGKGNMNYDTVFGNNITYVSNDLGNPTQNLANSVNGRIVEPYVLSGGNTNQTLMLDCNSAGKNYMLWQISPADNVGASLTANRSYAASSGEKAYVSWAHSSSSNSQQRFFIFYSLNSDGGYYMSPVTFKYGTREEENFRIVEIAAYETPETLQLWDYKFGSNGRFWIDSASTDELQAEIVDVLVDFETDGRIKNIDKVYTYWIEGTQKTDVLTLKYNSAFYSPDEAKPGRKYDTTRYESQGYYYAFDSASNVSDKNTTCYRLFFRYVGGGQSVIVKNADAINKSKTFTIESFLNDNTKTSPDYRYKPLDTSYTYKNSVYAPYQIDIIPDVNVKCCWYVNDKEDLLGAEKVGNGSSSSGTDTFTRSNGAAVSISYSFSSVDNSSQQYTKLEVKNPTKLHNGLYFICIVAGGSDYASMSFAEKLTASEVTKLEAKKCINSGYNRLDVANNILYHNVDRNGIEQGIVEEDWIIYGTDLEIDEASVPFAANGGYIKYDKYFVDDGVAYYERNDGKNVIKRNYKIMNRPAAAGETDSDDLGWMLFEATIKNPNNDSTFTFANYIAAYKNYYNGNANVEYVDTGVEHKFWRVKEQISFALSGDLVSDGTNKQLVHDTTINLYTERKANIAPEKIKYQVFVDDFGTTFMAEETNKNGWTIISTSKETDGNNKFIKGDKIIAPVVAKNSADANSIKLSGGDIQVKDKNGNWVNVDEVSGLDVDDDISTSTASLWCKSYVNSSLNAGNFVDAVEINAIDLLTYYGKSNLQGDFEVVFRFSTGSVNTGGWFGTASGEEECCRIKFVPFDYFTLN